MASPGRWKRFSLLLGVALFLGALMIPAAGRAAPKAQCMVRACRPDRNACVVGFRSQMHGTMASCTGPRRARCRRAAARQYRQNRLRCETAYKVCSSCCGGSDTSACTAAVCGDGVKAGNEECEPQGTGACDSNCRLLAAATTTTTTTPATSTTTTTLASAPSGVSVIITDPPNGTHFVAGDPPHVAVVLKDGAGNPLTLDQLSIANLYMYGPQAQSKTKTAVALLRASTDRNARPHHYIDLKTNPDVIANGNVVVYPLSAVTNEAPGTYTVAVWAVLKADALQQWMPLADCQIGTPTPETQTVEEDRCGKCHLGAASGKYYMHHIDPGFSPTGNPALDSWPVRTCKSCHNNDGYAGYNNGAGGKDANVNRTTDPIVRRVHGVHRGVELAAPFNTDPVKGDFKDYTDLEFPQDLRNCAACHVDNRWKTQGSLQSCASCHDNVWFGDQSATPAGYQNHPGGQVADGTCMICHAPGALFDASARHVVPPPPLNVVDVSMTPPGNGTYYVAGETPVVTIVIRNDNGDSIDHTAVNTGNFTTASLFVSGPRSHTLPVLTNTAKYGVSKLRASVQNGVDATGTPTAGWTFGATDAFKLAVNGGAPLELTVPGGGLMTPAQVKTWLSANLTGVTVTSTSTRVTIKSNVQGSDSRIDIYNSPVTTIMGWKPAGVTMEPAPNVAQSSTPGNDLRALSDPLDYADPNVTRSGANITYQLLDVAGLPAGTYSVYVWSRPTAGKITGLSKVGIGFLNFQVGTATPEKKIASNCTDCHGATIMHVPTPTERGPHPAPFDTDYCKSCHDYSHYGIGEGFANQGGTSTSGWSGFGAVPISRRVHGVHFGHYLEHSNEIYAGGDPFGGVIFPQDVRNCIKCHSETDAWTANPSRVACLGCHDSNAAKAHGTTMTVIKDPTDPYGTKAFEACTLCHGKNGPWAPSIVHNIWDPYRPPYPR